MSTPLGVVLWPCKMDMVMEWFKSVKGKMSIQRPTSTDPLEVKCFCLIQQIQKKEKEKRKGLIKQ